MKTSDKTRITIINRIWDPVVHQMYDQVSPQVTTQVLFQVRDQVMSQVGFNMLVLPTKLHQS